MCVELTLCTLIVGCPVVCCGLIGLCGVTTLGVGTIGASGLAVALVMVTILLLGTIVIGLGITAVTVVASILALILAPIVLAVGAAGLAAVIGGGIIAAVVTGTLILIRTGEMPDETKDLSFYFPDEPDVFEGLTLLDLINAGTPEGRAKLAARNEKKNNTKLDHIEGRDLSVYFYDQEFEKGEKGEEMSFFLSESPKKIIEAKTSCSISLKTTTTTSTTAAANKTSMNAVAEQEQKISAAFKESINDILFESMSHYENDMVNTQVVSFDSSLSTEDEQVLLLDVFFTITKQFSCNDDDDDENKNDDNCDFVFMKAQEFIQDTKEILEREGVEKEEKAVTSASTSTSNNNSGNLSAIIMGHEFSAQKIIIDEKLKCDTEDASFAYLL